MKKVFIVLVVFFIQLIHVKSQTTIAFWDFNFGNDATTSTGTTLPAIGTGTITLIGGTSSTYAAGHSSDPNSTDNSGLNTTTYPAQSTSPKSAGIQINVNTTGLDDIQIEFWHRLSNTAANTWVLQYTLDVTEPIPVWVDAQTYTFTPQPTGTGDTWYFRTHNFSSVTGLNNNPNAAFRFVSDFDPIAGQYLAARSTSTYNTAGTSRFDLVKIYAAPNTSNVTLTNATYSILENAGVVNVGVSLTAAGGDPVKVKLKWLSGTTATIGADVTATNVTTVSFSGLQDSIAQVSFPITDDVLSEKTEYFALELLDSVNAVITGTSVSTIYIKDNDYTAPIGNGTLQLQHIHSYQVGAAGSNSSEISAYDNTNQRLYTANSIANKLEILSLSNPYNISPIASIPLNAYGKINSVAVHNGIVALALENNNAQLDGFVVFMDENGNYINQVTVGAMPDMITFTHDYSKILTANEGEPNANYTVDPEGSVSIIDISGGIASLTQANVTTVGFTSFNADIATLRNAGVRIFGPGATVAQDFEPEYITIDPTNTNAYVTLQENNAIAVLDLATNTFTDIYPLGFKDHSLPGNALDISDQGGNIHIANWPIKGLYMPDAIASYEIGGQLYLVTANEGDARDYSPTFNEEVRIGNAAYVLDTNVFGDMTKVLKPNLNAGRLTVTNATGDNNNNGKFEEIHVFGTRSFSIWNATTGTLVFDSGDDFEQITLADPTYGSIFNADHSGVAIKNRSDNKGPEPEGVALATINDTVYAFVSMERIGGIMVYDVTNPSNPQFVQYINNRSTTSATTGDRGAEGIIYIPYTQSPIDTGLVIISNEVSSTISVYKVNQYFQPDPVADFESNLQVICEGTSIQFTDLSQFNPISWDWSFPGATPSSSTSQNPTVVYNTAGTYDVTLTVTNAYGTNSVTFTNYIQVNTLPTAISSSNSPVCAGDDLTLEANGGSSYSWTGPNFFSSNDQNPEIEDVTVANAGIYSVVVTASNGCTATASTSVVINPLPTANASANSPLCAGSDLTLFASGGSGYEWEGPNNFSSNNQNPVINSIATNAGGEYIVTVTNNNGCSSSASVIIQVLDCSSVEELNSLSSLMIYPNPADAYIQFELTEVLNQPATIRLLSADGKIISTSTWIETIQYRMDVSTLPSGTYIVQINTTTSVISRIILIAR